MFRGLAGTVQYGDQPLETIVSDHSVAELLSSGDGTEVVRWTIKPGGRVGLAPNEGWHGTEFFYVVNGCLQGEIDGRPVVLKHGKIMTAANIPESVILAATEQTTLLYITSRPTFHLLSQQVKQLMELAVQVEEQDDYTAGHCRRIRDISIKVAERLQLPSNALFRLSMASYLHDVGKCRIPHEMLVKPGPLTDDEWLLMKKHPIFGREMVEQTCIAEVGPAIEQHHERFDGSGYPYGLSGTDILVEARIIAVVDSFDAMITDRPYRKAISVPEALEELQRGAGTLYDPEVVDVAIQVIEAMYAESKC